MSEPDPIYLHIGRYETELAGFVNIDTARDEHAATGTADELPFGNGTVSGIYAERFLEHLSQGETLAFLRECRRVLQPGGTLRIATLDLAAVVDGYVRDDWRRPQFGAADYEWLQSRAEFLNTELKEIHGWLADEEELARLGAFSGLISPARRQPGESGNRRFLDLPAPPASSLVMEFGKREDAARENPLVSIVIPAYKSRFFRECLDSALGQSYPQIEILVLDDSPDARIESIVQALDPDGARIRYLRNSPALGEVANLTRGISLAQGEFIKPLYDDDLLLPEAVAELVALFRKYPDARLAAGRRVLIDHTGAVMPVDLPLSDLLRRHGRLNGTDVVSELAGSGVNMLGEPTVMMFRKGDALEIDEPNVASLFGRLCFGIADLALATHLLSKGDLAYSTNTISMFRIHEEQTQRREGFKEIVEATWIYYRKQVARLGFHRTFPAVAPEPAKEKRGTAKEDPAPADAAAATQAAESGQIANPRDYGAWLHARACTPQDAARLGADGLPETGFLIFLRIRQEEQPRLAETLDSLNYQLHKNWHVHVLATNAPPAGIETVACLTWHTVADDGAKPLIDRLAAAQEDAWNVELPPGAVLDPLCLWRIAAEARTSPDIRGFFVDDDIYDKKGNREKPRFKPGTNPAWLQSSDLAGPLFLRGDAWQECGGASLRRASAWFDQLVRFTDRFGWASLAHVPDVLISYPDEFPADIESCLLSLLGNLQEKGIPADIEPASTRSWRIRHPLQRTPRVTIAIVSQGQMDLIVRCTNSVIEKTDYADYEIVIVAPALPDDPELDAWLEESCRISGGAIRALRSTPDATFGGQCNMAAAAATGEFIVVLGDGCVAVSPRWVEELVRPALQPGVAGCGPQLLVAGSALLEQTGSVLGLSGTVGTPYGEAATPTSPGYLDWLKVPRDIGILPDVCFLASVDRYRENGGMDETAPSHLAVADLSLRLRSGGLRLLYQPTAALVGYRYAQTEVASDPEAQARAQLDLVRAEKTFSGRWLRKGIADPFWNPNLSFAECVPQLETAYAAQWQRQPGAAPRFLARPVTNPQGDFRITAYLKALRDAGKASECIWPQIGKREPTVAEILRLAPDSLIVQHYILDHQLAALRSWHDAPDRPFIVFAMDDLLTKLDSTNPFRKEHPANNRSRLKFALERCDRLVVSTDYLADCFSHLTGDVRIVPNRLEMATWLPLRSGRRTSARPRIGWAGGTTHLGDLALLKEVIERTRGEADWIFFGMCPPEIRPLLAEYHELVAFADYPARLASLNFDIAVAPLAETPFNRGKSNLRLLEYGMLGIPVVCTDIDPYRNSPACRVENTVEAWVGALRERIHDADAREREGHEMRRWVRKGFLLEDHIDEWLSAHLP